MDPFTDRLNACLEALRFDIDNLLIFPTPKDIHLRILEDLASSTEPLTLTQIKSLAEISPSSSLTHIERLAGLLAIYDFPVRLVRIPGIQLRQCGKYYHYRLRRLPN
jgi:hypothetical protein